MTIPSFPDTKVALKGKKGLIVGIANDQSIAWGCAKAFRALGADLAVKARDIAIVLAGLRDDVRENLTAVGAEQDLGPIPAHRTIEDCLRHGAGLSILMESLG